MLRQGATGLGMGMLRGATSLVYEPLKGARRDGARGLAVGVGKGIAGPRSAPAGLLQLADRWAGAWGVLTHSLTGDADGAASHGGRSIGRVRPPRMLHDDLRRVAPFSMAEAFARHVLTSTEEGRYLGEPLLHCDLVLEGGGKAGAVVIVLTGMRLLAVDSHAWRVQVNVPLRKLHSVSVGGGHVLVMHLKPRKAGGGGGGGGGGSGGGSRHHRARRRQKLQRAIYVACRAIRQKRCPSFTSRCKRQWPR